MPPSTRSTRTDVGIEGPELVAQAPRRELADLARDLDAGRPGADDRDREPLLAARSGSVAVSAISNAPKIRRRSSSASSIVFMPGREERELVVPEVRLAGAGGHDQAVVRHLDRLAGRAGRVHDAALEVEARDLGELDADVGGACAARGGAAARSGRASRMPVATW